MEVWNQRIFLMIFLILCIGHVLADSTVACLDSRLQLHQDQRTLGKLCRLNGKVHKETVDETQYSAYHYRSDAL